MPQFCLMRVFIDQVEAMSKLKGTSAQQRVVVEHVTVAAGGHTFATEYLKHGGDVVRLSKRLGHADVSTTMSYVPFVTADLQEAHQRLSILARLR